MRIITKLSVSLFCLSVAVFGAQSALYLRTESQDMHAILQRGTRIIAHSLRAAVENALRDRQTEDIQDLLRQLDQADHSVDVRVYIRDGQVVRSDAETLVWDPPLERILEAAAAEGQSRLLYYPEDDPRFIVMSLPFSTAKTASFGSLAVVRSLAELREDLRRSERNVLVALATFVVSAALVCWGLGQIYISRPLARLGEAMRRFSQGSPPMPLPARHRDELSAVIREFNRMVAELSEARQRLDDETEQHRQLQRALQQADKLISIGQLSAGLAHEIGSPLQVVNGRARHLAACADRPEEVRRLAAILVSQTDRITRIVQRLLELARRRPPLFERANVAGIVGEVFDLLRHESRRRRIDLKFDPAPALLFAFVQVDGVQQIVLNLLSNALAASAEGGVVSLSLREATMDHEGVAVPALRITVEDSGCGIAAEDLPRLFEPFFTTRGGQGGTGLGLAVVKSIATEHGGTVAAESGSGGSRFTVHLPLEGPAYLREA